MSKHTAYQPPTKSNKGNADSETEDPVSKNKNTNLHFSTSHRPAAFRYHPIVFLFERTYCIMLWENFPMTVSVEINGQIFYDDTCGVLCSSSPIHKILVPMEQLDAAGSYTISYKMVIKRVPAFTEISPDNRITYPFFPLPNGDSFTLCQISDSHAHDRLAVSAASYRPFDLLILSGDLQNEIQTTEDYAHMYRIASALTHGRLPVLYARGNHDCRGAAAEKIAEFTPALPTRAYYFSQLSNISFLVLDCGEDKPDDHAEYGGTVCFSAYREKQSVYLHALFDHAVPDTSKYRILISHTPFSYTDHPPFDIEQERYAQWLALLKAHYAPHIMICGHLHQAQFSPIGGTLDSKGQICPVVIGCDSPGHSPDGNKMSVCYYRFIKNTIEIELVDQDGKRTFLSTVEI